MVWEENNIKIHAKREILRRANPSKAWPGGPDMTQVFQPQARAMGLNLRPLPAASHQYFSHPSALFPLLR